LSDLTTRLADRLRALRRERGMTLEALAAECGVSRGTLSRIETGETSPTAEVLGRLGAVYGLPISRLMRMAEGETAPLVRKMDQDVWEDAESGFFRRDVSPPADDLSGHVIEGRMRPGAVLRYDRTPVQDLEHHLVLQEGDLIMEVADTSYRLAPGDCLRYRLDGSTVFRAGADGAAYYIFIL